ncbi:hypothetical protein C0J52_02050 [Blattella germanica]|nr:hypothetical protein C0J52_02050 [Blattella germanica]
MFLRKLGSAALRQIVCERAAFHTFQWCSAPHIARVFAPRAEFKKPGEVNNGGQSTRDQDSSQDAASTEDVLFDMFKNQETGLLPIGMFLAALRSTGLRKTDPRLAEMMENLKQVHRKSGQVGGSPETQKLDRETFKSVVSANVVLISRAFRHQFVIPDFQGFTKHIEDFYWKCKSNTEGKVAAYIPQLARVNPDLWGISVCTIDGQRFSIGDVNIPFTLQSCSGRNFNELVLDHNKKPHNPMINAGAILICTLLKTLVLPEMTLAEKFDFTMNYFKKLAGGEHLGFNNSVFLSERESADRNYALGFFMREYKCYPDKTNLRECMDLYFQELVNVFNFHRYDNLKHASNKKDPRRHKYETKGLSIVNLLFSAASGDVTAMRRHKLSGMDMTLCDYDGRTALHLAAAEGHLDCVTFLLEHCKVPFNPKDRWGNMPITEARTFGHEKIVEYLESWESSQEEKKPEEPETIPSTTLTDESVPLPHIMQLYLHGAVILCEARVYPSKIQIIVKGNMF